jgi:carotenoid cleavage dioxygenase-like enzyme
MITLFDNSTDFNTYQNLYTTRHFAPVNEENSNIPVEIITGEIPSDLQGLLLRIGPNPIPTQFERLHHLFDGHGMIHSIRVEDGKALYSNQWIETPRYKLERKFKRGLFLTLGEMYGWFGLLKILLLNPLYRYVFDLDTLTEGTANTHVLLHNNKLYACHEGSFPFQIQWNENNKFDSLGFDNLNNQLDFPVTAHSKIDPVTGHLFFNGYGVDSDINMKVGSVKDKIESYYEVKLKSKTFSHDMSITENYIVLIEPSVIFDTLGIMEGKLFRFAEENNLRIGIVSKNAKSSDNIKWFDTGAARSLIHVMNSWEDNEDEIVVIAPLSNQFDGLNPRAERVTFDAYMSEIRLNMKTGNVTITPMTKNTTVEFPTIHPDFVGRYTKYGFAGQGEPGDSLGFREILKFDLSEKKVINSITIANDGRCGEPIPIAKPPTLRVLQQEAKVIEDEKKENDSGGEAHEESEEAREESINKNEKLSETDITSDSERSNEESLKPVESDDVYLGVFVNFLDRNETEWHLYDGKTMSSEPVLVARLGGKRVPYGFHGLWIPNDKLMNHIQAKEV